MESPEITVISDKQKVMGHINQALGILAKMKISKGPVSQPRSCAVAITDLEKVLAYVNFYVSEVDNSLTSSEASKVEKAA